MVEPRRLELRWGSKPHFSPIRPHPSKSKRTSPPSSFSLASKVFPDLDSNPLSTGVRPDFSNTWADLTEILLPAIRFQMVKPHPFFQPEQPKAFGPSATSEPHRGQ